MRHRMLVGAILAILSTSLAAATTTGPSLDETRAALDAARARIAAQTAQYHDPVGPRTWIDGSRLWYCETARDGARRWWLVDATRSGRNPLFDHVAAAWALPAADGAARSPDRLPVRGVAVERGRVVVSLETLEHPLVFDLSTGGLVDAAGADPELLKALELRLAPGEPRSRGQGPSSGIRFVNELDEEVEILWIDARGERRTYGRIAPGAERVQHTFGGHAWTVRTAAGESLGSVVAAEIEKTVRIARPAREPEPVETLDGQKDAPADGAREPAAPARPALPALEVARDGANLVLRQEGREFFRTADGADGDAYEAHWLAPGRDAVFALQVRRAPARPVHIVESSPKDQLQPKLRTLSYVKPGDEIDRARPRLLRIEAGEGGAPAARAVPLDDALFATPWSIDRVRFLPGGREVAFLYNQRGHQVVRLVAIDLATGAARTIAEESYPTFVDYTNKIWMHWLDETGELLWMTERSGRSQIVLVDVATGVVKREVTAGPALVRRVDHVDARARTIDVALMGHDPAQDPYHVHFARVAIDTGAVVMLTSGDGTCRVDFSPDRTALVAVRARADRPPVYEMRRASDGAVVAALGTADDGAMRAAGWIAPEPFVAKGRDGTTDIWGLVFRPSGFDPSRRYPVIEQIYAGPHGQHVPKWFELSGRSREYAELGAIVVQIDGMGTNWRGKAFHDLCWKNLKDAGFPDRIAWMRALAAREPAADLSRVGIFGGSAGGQNAMRAVLDHAEFYRVAVADCGCHDNRMDKIWWNEQWMGWPIDESYARSSNMEDAARLGGALMLVVGALDENVDPASTMQVAQRLIEAGKDFELVVIPDGGHGAAESAYGNARRAQFLLEHLGPPR